MSLFNPSFESRIADIGVVFDARHHGRGWPLEAPGLLIRYAFQHWDFRKLYARIPGFNFPSLRSLPRLGFAEEGRLRDYDFYDGRYWDEHILGVAREDWERHGAPLLKRYLARAAVEEKAA